MLVLVLSGVLVLAVGGCVCVVWAARGGPRWVRGAAAATLMAGELVGRAGRKGRRAGSDDNGTD
ncbi:hypothetical protein ACWC0A_26605 [Streptomyces scopuliridis]